MGSSPKMVSQGPTEAELRARRQEERVYQASLREQMRAEAKADEEERRAYEEEQAKKTAQLRISQELVRDQQKDAQKKNMGANVKRRRNARGSMFSAITGMPQIPTSGTYN